MQESKSSISILSKELISSSRLPRCQDQARLHYLLCNRVPPNPTRESAKTADAIEQSEQIEQFHLNNEQNAHVPTKISYVIIIATIYDISVATLVDSVGTC